MPEALSFHLRFLPIILEFVQSTEARSLLLLIDVMIDDTIYKV
ncbi:hypothetical protein [Chroogloeocystis siderophila]|jgi:hypothetical protein|nr:hypothetical protein [Chroogloeocystis siderophila]